MMEEGKCCVGESGSGFIGVLSEASGRASGRAWRQDSRFMDSQPDYR